MLTAIGFFHFISPDLLPFPAFMICFKATGTGERVNALPIVNLTKEEFPAASCWAEAGLNGSKPSILQNETLHASGPCDIGLPANPGRQSGKSTNRTRRHCAACTFAAQGVSSWRAQEVSMSDGHKTQELVFGPRLRPRDAARYLGIAAQTLARWRCEGVGPAFHKLGGAIVAYSLEDLDRWLLERRASSNAEVFARQETEAATCAGAKRRGRPKAKPAASEAAAR